MFASSGGLSTGREPEPGILLHGDRAGQVEGVGGHRQRAVGVPVDQHVRAPAGRRAQPGQVQQRDEVVRGGHRGVEVRGGLHARQRVRGAGHDLPGALVEPVRPVEPAVPPRRVDAAEVVHHVAAADDGHPAVPQRGQLGAQLEVVVEGLHRVDRQLHDRDVRVRVHVGEHRPGAVVQPPAVHVLPDPGRLGDLLHLGGQLRRARRRVVQGEQVAGEPEEVVDGARAAHRGHRGRVDVPVRGDHQDGPRPGQRGAQRVPAAGVAVVFQGVGRAAVPDERGRHRCAHEHRA